jgi:hypothetical protein
MLPMLMALMNDLSSQTGGVLFFSRLICSAYGHRAKADGKARPSSVIEAVTDKKGIFYMNRIAPGTSELYVANVDGTDERPLLSFQAHLLCIWTQGQS